MRYLIVTGGNLSSEFAIDCIKNGGFEVILAVDAGMEQLHRIGIAPDMIVGDFDSVKEEVLDYYRGQEQIEICALDTAKDDTDTEHAIHLAIRRGATDITVIGATGTRIDHVLGNIALLGIGLEEGVHIELLDPNNRIQMINQAITLKREEQYGRYISLIPYAGQAEGVTLKGFKYPLEDYTMGGFNALGVSNEMVEDVASISLTNGQLVVIESRD